MSRDLPIRGVVDGAADAPCVSRSASPAGRWHTVASERLMGQARSFPARPCRAHPAPLAPRPLRAVSRAPSTASHNRARRNRTTLTVQVPSQAESRPSAHDAHARPSTSLPPSASASLSARASGTGAASREAHRTAGTRRRKAPSTCDDCGAGGACLERYLIQVKAETGTHRARLLRVLGKSTLYRKVRRPT